MLSKWDLNETTNLNEIIKSIKNVLLFFIENELQIRLIK